MSCTCNKSINCEPCAFCTPPGVTCLTTCTPVDPCLDKIDMSCVIYSGADHNCSDIKHGESISLIMLQALSLIFDVDVCCDFSADAIRIGNLFQFCKVTAQNGTCNMACACNLLYTTPINLYAFLNTLAIGNTLYTDTACDTPVGAGLYGLNGLCYTINASGVITDIRVCVPPTTSTTTAAPTTTSSTTSTSTTSTTSTTTLPPCNCITWDNTLNEQSGVISYTDCTGTPRTGPLPMYTKIQHCGSNGSSSVALAPPIVGGPCTFSGDAYHCVVASTTTKAPSQFILYCCKNPTLTPISIQPSYPNTNVAFALNNVYIDNEGRYWVVAAVSGTPSVTTGLPTSFTYVNPYGLGPCQTSAANQIALCPGVVTTTTLPPPIQLGYSATSLLDACNATKSTYYSNCGTKLIAGNGCSIYTNNTLTTHAPNGYYSNGTTTYTLTGGFINAIGTCSSVTTAPPSTTTSTTTATPNTITITNNTPSGSGITITDLATPNSPINGVIWRSNFISLSPGKSNTGDYFNQNPPYGQLRVSMSSTTNTADPSGYYIHVSDGISGGYRNSLSVPKILTTGLDFDLPSHTYHPGNQITITLNNTP